MRKVIVDMFQKLGWNKILHYFCLSVWHYKGKDFQNKFQIKIKKILRNIFQENPRMPSRLISMRLLPGKDPRWIREQFVVKKKKGTQIWIPSL